MSGLLHQAFVYESPDDFVSGMGPVAREGIERGDAVFAATTPPNLAALREELGPDGRDVELQDTAEWQTRPWERLQAFRRMVDGLRDGQRLWAMGEPVWEGPDAVIRQWARYESIINAALAEAPMRFVCLYDGASLPDEILAYAIQTHPERVGSDGDVVSCPGYVAPEAFATAAPPVPSDESTSLPLAGGWFRRQLAEHSLEAGLPPTRVDEFVLAANEVLTNALKHGWAPIDARVWTGDGEVVCRIADAGPGVTDPLAGWLPPSGARAREGGWGLAIARQLCDAVDTVPGDDSAVWLHMSLPAWVIA